MMQIESSPKLVDFSKLPNNLTPLYALPVANAGTGYSQSLSSYVAMLAARHRIGLKTLVNVIADNCKGGSTCSLSRKYVEAGRLDVGGPYAELLSETLQALTGVPLVGCSWVKLQNAFSRNFLGIVRLTRQWCSQCYRDHREQYGNVYDPLIWSYPGAMGCPIHNVGYEDTCPVCSHHQPVVAAQVDHWYCNYCKSELVGITPRRRAHENEAMMAWNRWLHRELGLLVSALWDPTFAPDRQNVKRFLSLLVKDDPLGYKGLSMRSGVAADTISQWVRRNSPRLDFFIKFCAALGISPAAALRSPRDAVGQLGQWPVPLSPTPRQKRLNLIRRDWPQVKQRLRDMIDGRSSVLSLTPACKLLGVSPGTLRYREPELIRQLVAKRKDEVTRARNIVWRRLELLGAKVFKEMREEHRHLTRRTFERELICRSGCGYTPAAAIYTKLYRELLRY